MAGAETSRLIFRCSLDFALRWAKSEKTTVGKFASFLPNIKNDEILVCFQLKIAVEELAWARSYESD